LLSNEENELIEIIIVSLKMILSQQPQQWSTQIGPSNLSNYERRQKFDNGTKNPEGMRNTFIVNFSQGFP
jgi:hypothetical protein